MSLLAFEPLADGCTADDADAFAAALRDNGMRKGFDVFVEPLCAQPNTLVLDVRRWREASALPHAEAEIDTGNYYGAYIAMRERSEPGTLATP